MAVKTHLRKTLSLEDLEFARPRECSVSAMRMSVACVVEINWLKEERRRQNDSSSDSSGRSKRPRHH